MCEAIFRGVREIELRACSSPHAALGVMHSGSLSSMRWSSTPNMSYVPARLDSRNWLLLVLFPRGVEVAAEEGALLSSRSRRYNWRFRTAEKALPRGVGILSGGFAACCEGGLAASCLGPGLALTIAPMTRRLVHLRGGSRRGVVGGIATALGGSTGAFGISGCAATTTGSPLSELSTNLCSTGKLLLDPAMLTAAAL